MTTLQHPTPRQPPAAGGHDHLHRDVRAGAAARRGQPRPGLPRLRLRPGAGRRRERRHARRPQPVPADGRRAGAARGDRRKIERALRPPLRRRQRDHRHRRRHAGDPDRDACCRARRATRSIVLEPCYDSYEPNIELAGGRAVHVPLTPGTFRPDFDRIAAALTPRTRADHHQHAAQPERHRLDARRHAAARRAAARHRRDRARRRGLRAHGVRRRARTTAWRRYPELAARSFVVSSFGKTYHVTGWKVGYVAAPAALMAEFRKVHQFNVFTVNTPMQHGLAALHGRPAPYLDLPAFYQRKRDLFRAGLAQHPAAPAGHAGQLLPVRGLFAPSAMLATRPILPWLTEHIGVAAIPLSAFYDGGFEQRHRALLLREEGRDPDTQALRAAAAPRSLCVESAARLRRSKSSEVELEAQVGPASRRALVDQIRRAAAYCRLGRRASADRSPAATAGRRRCSVVRARTGRATAIQKQQFAEGRQVEAQLAAALRNSIASSTPGIQRRRPQGLQAGHHLGVVLQRAAGRGRLPVRRIAVEALVEALADALVGGRSPRRR